MVGVKGVCMGAADVIPGVSGGTIAFIMGIYDDFVGSLASINAEAMRLLFRGKFKAFWKHINGGFLLSLVLGILVSIISLAGLMQMLLNDYPIPTWAFFFGLIVASSIFILRGISGWKVRELCFLVLGVALGVVVCTLSPTQTPDALWFIFLSGAIAICAMILPGISGSFILLILGKYQFIMECITELVSGVAIGRNLLVLCIFAAGAVVGILAFSKFLHWLLARWNKETLIVLAGFIIGSLVKVWPWSNTQAIVCSQFPEVAALGEAAEVAADRAANVAVGVAVGADGVAVADGAAIAAELAANNGTELVANNGTELVAGAHDLGRTAEAMNGIADSATNEATVMADGVAELGGGAGLVDGAANVAAAGVEELGVGSEAGIEAAQIAAADAQAAFDSAVAQHAEMIDPQIGLAIVFALLGFILVTAIELAGMKSGAPKEA